MAGTKDSGYIAEVVWLGVVPVGGGSLRSEARDTVDLAFGGVEGEAHAGDRRPSCSRVTNLYPKGTEITNTRQLSVLSDEEMGDIAAAMGLDALDPGLIGASMILRGIPDFSHVPPGSRLLFDSGACVTIDLENGPCVFPGREIEAEAPGHGKLFKPAANDRRGVTAWVERPGAVALGDKLRLFVPDQRAWAP
ncbi:MOSC domain-containing protein [Sedimentitalea arenosa]|uniref:Sulfurase n=1 Tax=Sedimentitalea arenosa TaxID=2798803 RepID=A0A8J7J8P2_9RHOB|nr:sulfurase [Arenibacterium arenosum]MBJ6370958.1 sulfurase [Arenibacterium arenosum]